MTTLKMNLMETLEYLFELSEQGNERHRLFDENFNEFLQNLSLADSVEKINAKTFLVSIEHKGIKGLNIANIIEMLKD